MSELLVGLLPDSSSAESAVNDYVEAGVFENRISLIMKDTATAQAIAGNAGPLKNTSPDALAARLAALGIAQSDAEALATAVQAGQALIALTIDPGTESDAVQVLRGLNGSHIITSPGR